MDKRKFLRRLEKSLKKLVPEERARYVSYYDEIIMDLVDSGMSEEEACAKQGDMSSIVADIMSQVEPEKVEKKKPLEIALLLVALLVAVACVIVLVALPDVITFSMMDGDGPISVFVGGKIVEPIWLYILTAVVLVASIVVFCVRKNKTFAMTAIVALVVCVVTFVVVRIGDYKEVEEQVTTEAVSVYSTPEVDAQTKIIIQLISDNDFATIREKYAIPDLIEVLKDEYMLEAKSMVCKDWGKLKSIGTVYSAEVVQNDVTYTVVQVNTTYENVSVAYTITFDDELMLAGIYMR